MFNRSLGLRALLTSISWALLQTCGTTYAQEANTPPLPTISNDAASVPIMYRVGAAAERIDMVVNTSRILNMGQTIPKAGVNNPDILELTPVSASQIQIHAKKTGNTQVNLWDDKGQIHAIDVSIIGDVKELSSLLKANFPNASLTVQASANSVILGGYIEKPESITPIVKIAQDFYPNVINNISVGLPQQVMLHVKVLEVSRTKLRDVGFDFADITSDGSFVRQSVGGLLRSVTSTTVATTGQETYAFGIIDGGNSFFGVLAALQRNNIAKLHAEPTLVTISGRPAQFQSGGKIPIAIPQGLGSVSIEFYPFGTQVDFVPIVKGDGRVRLEVRPSVSEIDASLSTTLNGSTIPGFRTRYIDTGVEMRFGQTLALAGLLQWRIETQKSGIPYVMDVPYLGAPFRRVNEKQNEIELLILVRPELAEALDPCEVPPCQVGDSSISPTDCELYFKGTIEVPNPPCLNGQCGQNCGNAPVQGQFSNPMPNGSMPQNGTTIEEVPAPRANSQSPRGTLPQPAQSIQPSAGGNVKGRTQAATRLSQPASVASRPPVRSATVPSAQSVSPATVRQPAQYNPPTTNVRKPITQPSSQSGEPGLIGPTGYDVNN